MGEVSRDSVFVIKVHSLCQKRLVVPEVDGDGEHLSKVTAEITWWEDTIILLFSML